MSLETKGIAVKDLLIAGTLLGMFGTLIMWGVSFGEFKNKSEAEWKSREENSKKIEELTRIQVRLVTIIEMMQKEDEESN